MSMMHSLGRKAKIKMKKPPCLAASEQTCCRLGELSSSMLIITFKTYNNFLIFFFFCISQNCCSWSQPRALHVHTVQHQGCCLALCSLLKREGGEVWRVLMEIRLVINLFFTTEALGLLWRKREVLGNASSNNIATRPACVDSSCCLFTSLPFWVHIFIPSPSNVIDGHLGGSSGPRRPRAESGQARG